MDGIQIFSMSFNLNSENRYVKLKYHIIFLFINKNFCGINGWNDYRERQDVLINHSSTSLTILFTSTLDQVPSKFQLA